MTISVVTTQADIEVLRPTSKSKIIDVVKDAGHDVDDWAISTTGNPDTNPKYCYEWYFEQKGQRALFCLWFESLQTDESGVFQSYSLWPAIKSMEARKNHAGAKRAGRLDAGLQRAFNSKCPVRVALVAGRMRVGFEGDPSKVEFRKLDDAEWRVTHFDHADGTFTIRRSNAREGGITLEPHTPEAVSTALEEAFHHPVMEDLEELAQRNIPATTRSALVDARLGQGAFRLSLMHHWENACAGSGCTIAPILRASHIVPWREATDEERLDPENGLLLTANIDALFDRGLIAFDDAGLLVLSSKLTAESAHHLCLPTTLRHPPSQRQRRYLQRHRASVFQP